MATSTIVAIVVFLLALVALVVTAVYTGMGYNRVRKTSACTSVADISEKAVPQLRNGLIASIVSALVFLIMGVVLIVIKIRSGGTA